MRQRTEVRVYKLDAPSNIHLNRGFKLLHRVSRAKRLFTQGLILRKYVPGECVKTLRLFSDDFRWDLVSIGYAGRGNGTRLIFYVHLPPWVPDSVGLSIQPVLIEVTSRLGITFRLARQTAIALTALVPSKDKRCLRGVSYLGDEMNCGNSPDLFLVTYRRAIGETLKEIRPITKEDFDAFSAYVNM